MGGALFLMSHGGQRGRWLARPTCYNQLLVEAFGTMRLAVIGLLALGGWVWAADLKESYEGLKDAFEKKDYAKVKALSADTAKEALVIEKEPQPTDPGQVDSWKGRQQFAKDAQ